MYNGPLEYLAMRYGNMVMYDAAGNPSIFVRFPKMKSKDLCDELPNHTHPAFIVNGVEQDSILLGKYKAAELTAGGALYSIPNALPMASDDTDALLDGMKAAGGGMTGMTIADYGFILLLAQKEGWEPHGNNNYGQYIDDATAWRVGYNMAQDTVRAFEGWTYQCLQTHTSSAALRPNLAPAYWKRLKHIGGTVYDGGRIWNRDLDGPYGTIGQTLNGSGPLDWYLGRDAGNLADLIGRYSEINYGYRVIRGEIQILPNNDAADPEAYLATASSAWKAILPNATDDGYTLVEPGTAGTLHWTKVGYAMTLDTVVPNLSSTGVYTDFKNLAVNSDNLPYVPCIVKELGIFPTTGSEVKGQCQMGFQANEMIVSRDNGGLGNVKANLKVRENEDIIYTTSYSARPRCLA